MDVIKVINSMQDEIISKAEERIGFALEREAVNAVRRQKSLLMLEAIYREIECIEPDRILITLKSLRK